jgi:hypothetical protein
MLCASNIIPVRFAPLRIPEPNYLQIANAAQWLCTQAEREAFVGEIYRELAAQGEGIGEGAIARVVAAAFSRHFDPPHGTDDNLLVPRQLRKPKRGKYA